MSNASYRFHRIICSLVVLALVVSASGLPLAAPRVQAASQEQAAASRNASQPATSSKVAATTADTFDSPLATPPATPAPLPPTPVPAPTIAPAPLPVFTPALTVTQQTVDRAGGRLQSADKRIQLDVPPGLFKNSTRLKISPMKFDAASVPPGTLLRFDLDALDLNANAALTSFDQPITLTIDVHSFPSAQVDPGWFVAYRDPNDPSTWHKLPVVVDNGQGVIRVALPHFSAYVSGSDPGQWQYQWNPPTVSEFSGAATFNYPVKVPAGRNGLAPNLDVSYSSRGVDGLVLANVDQGLLGAGWSMSDIEISRDGVYPNPDGASGRMGLHHPDQFSLAMNGTGYQLHAATHSVTDAVVRYYADNAPQLFIQRVYDPNATDANVDRFYWLVKTPDGTIYRLGYTPDSETNQTVQNSGPQVFVDPGNGDGGNGTTWPSGGPGAARGASADYSGIRWRVDTVTDILGNQLQYFYTQWSGRTYYTATYQDSVLSTFARLTEIRYNYASLAPNAMTRLTSSYASRITIEKPTSLQVLVKIYHTNLSTPVRTINFGLGGSYHQDSCGWTTTPSFVSSIQEQGSDGSLLPATTMTYTAKPHSKTTQTCYLWDYLEQVNNGYGGLTKFTYLGDGRADLSGGCQPGQPCLNVPSYGQSYAAIKQQTWDGIHSQPATIDYQFSWPCYDQILMDNGSLGNGTFPNAYNCLTRDRIPGAPDSAYGHSPIIGFGVTTATTSDYNGQVLGKTVLQFHQDRYRLGRAFSTQSQDAFGGLLQLTNSTYVTTTNGSAIVTYLSQADQTTYASGTSVTQRTTYTYDTYGNKTAQLEYGNVSISGDERSTYWAYAINSAPAVWIVNKVSRESIYTGLEPSDDSNPLYLKALTRYRYDNVCPFSLSSQPVKGLLTAVDQWNGLVGDSDHCGQSPINQNYSSTGTAYDQWGNTKVVTDTRGYPTKTDYDGTYNIYPVLITNAKIQYTVTTYDPVLGVPIAVTDPNGAVTNYTYDTFGRLHDIYKPGDGYGTGSPDPSTRYSYYDNGTPLLLSPFFILEWHKPASIKASVRHFYDGLGREIQTHTAYSVTLSGYSAAQDILVSRQFDARGLVVSETVPYAVPAYTAWPSNPYTTVNLASAPKTLTQYDALGRATTVTAPDGTATTQSYYIAFNSGDSDFNPGKVSSNTTDANGHVKRYSYDGLGHLSIVTEFVPGTEYRTHYTYDPLNNLTDVWDAAQNHTHMDYDALSRKTGMTDPDMGNWSYQYDNAGNLTVQDDAKHQRSCFYYDQLNRLLGKYYTNDTTTCATTNPPYVVTYTYDAYDGVTQFGRGRRTSMSMADSSSSASWTYDIRGRMTNEAKTIAGAGTFNTGYAYDTLDRMASITYPTGEVVRQTYDNASRLLSVSGAANYASGMQYNAMSQLRQITLGNGATTSYAYYGNGGGAPAINSFRLWQVNTNKAGNLLNLQYGYDNVGNVRTITDSVNSTQIQSFTYDELDRLKTATTNAAGAGQYTDGYTYTSIGNIDTKNGTVHYQYDPAHKHAATVATNGNTYSYDANGNMVMRTENGVTYNQGWDAENRLVTVTTSSQSTRFTYDGDGNRVKKTDSSGTTAYIGNLVEVKQPTRPVAWVSRVNTAGTGNTLQKTSGTQAWDAGAVSSQMLPNGDGYVEVVATAATDVMFGLSNGNTNASYTDLDYGLYMVGNILEVYEQGVGKWMGQSYAVGDRLRVAVENGVVRYYRNGTLLYTSSTPPTYPLLVDTSIYPSDGYVWNANLCVNGNCQPVAWVSQVNTAATGNTLQKTNGIWGWNGGAVSGQVLPGGDGYVEAVATAANAYVMFGLSNGNTDVTFGDIDYALYMCGDGNLYVYEQGVYKWGSQPYAVGDQLRVAVENGAVRYYRNGILLYTSSIPPIYPLLVDTSIGNPDGYVWNANLCVNGNCQPVAWVSRVNTAATGNTLQKTSGTTGWDAGAVSSQALVSGDGYVEAVATAATDVMFGLSNGNTDASYGDIDYGLEGVNGALFVYEQGVYKWGSQPYTVGDRLRVAVENGAVRYYRNGTLLYTSSTPPTYPLLVDTSIYTSDGYVWNATLTGGFTDYTSYYYAGSTRIAMRQGGVLYYFGADHLGSTSLTMDASGNSQGLMGYKPFGETRYGTTPTDRRFTGQRSEEATLGSLYDYGARFYSPYLNRWIQPDTIVPQPGNPQTLNRYSYVENNPVKLTDPTGHTSCNCDPTLQDQAQTLQDALFDSGHHQSWEQLPLAVREMLAYKGWNEHSWNAENVVGKGLSYAAETNGDPVVAIPLITFGPLIAEAAGAALTRVMIEIGSGVGADELAAEASGTRTVLSGHGGYSGGMVTVPDGTSVTAYSPTGGSISDSLGNAIETNSVPDGVFREVWRSGEQMPNYTLYPPDNRITIMGNPLTVQAPTRLSELLTPNMGAVHWAACTACAGTPWTNWTFTLYGPLYEP